MNTDSVKKNSSPKLSVIILTFNEEKNLPFALESIENWAFDVHVVDSGSTDNTLIIAKKFKYRTYYNPWIDWAAQRNWALDNCSLKYDWILFLDADEQVTADSKSEIEGKIAAASDPNRGFYLSFHYYFLGRLVRKGMNPHLRLVKKDIRWFGAGAREYCTAPLNSPVIQAPLIHKENRDLLYLCHNYVNKARMEAQFISDQFNAMAKSENKNPDDQAEPRTLYHRKTSRTILYRYFPPVIRSFIIFFYRLIFKTDFRDGWIGILHAFFFGLWYHILIDFMFVEIKMNMKRESKKRKVRF